VTTCYELDCTDCSFETIVPGSFTEAIEEVEAHRRAEDAGSTAHFVNVCRQR